ncbi:heme ABC transporter ATP-binding protein [Salegentibacter sp. HM20]
MLKAKHIGKQIKRDILLDDCSFQLEPGKFTAVVGPNGAGKTTLLKIISGESSNYSGEITLNGNPLRHYKNRELSLSRAILPQQTVVNFPFTVEQIIEVGRYAHRSSAAKNQAIIEEVMKLCGLNAFKGRIFQTLSGGEKQRVQMARVMAQIWEKSEHPKYVLLDEPTASLDLAQQHVLLSLARRLCRQNIAVIAVLHDLNLAIQYADDLLFLKKGKAVAYGEVKEVASRKIIEETFGHPVNLLEHQGQLIVVPDSNTGRGQKHHFNLSHKIVEARL